MFCRGYVEMMYRLIRIFTEKIQIRPTKAWHVCSLLCKCASTMAKTSCGDQSLVKRDHLRKAGSLLSDWAWSGAWPCPWPWPCHAHGHAHAHPCHGHRHSPVISVMDISWSWPLWRWPWPCPCPWAGPWPCPCHGMAIIIMAWAMTMSMMMTSLHGMSDVVSDEACLMSCRSYLNSSNNYGKRHTHLLHTQRHAYAVLYEQHAQLQNDNADDKSITFRQL